MLPFQTPTSLAGSFLQAHKRAVGGSIPRRSPFTALFPCSPVELSSCLSSALSSRSRVCISIWFWNSHQFPTNVPFLHEEPPRGTALHGATLHMPLRLPSPPCPPCPGSQRPAHENPQAGPQAGGRCRLVQPLCPASSLSAPFSACSSLMPSSRLLHTTMSRGSALDFWSRLENHLPVLSGRLYADNSPFRGAA